MRVAFVQYGPDISCATMMVDSCKRLGYEVIQLSDLISPDVPGVDVVLREPMTDPRMLWRCKRLASLGGEYVLLDTDMLVMKDIADGIGEEDATVSWRFPNIIVMPDGKQVSMPYNGGLIFVRNNEFMCSCLDVMRGQSEKLQDWYGDQVALLEVVKSGRFKVRELRDRKWNFVPSSWEETTPDLRVLHFKGLRKSMMAKRYAHDFGVTA